MSNEEDKAHKTALTQFKGITNLNIGYKFDRITTLFKAKNSKPAIEKAKKQEPIDRIREYILNL